MLSASIAFVGTNSVWATPKPLLQAERAHTQGVKPYVYALFSVSEVFAVAKVKLCRCRTSGTVKLLVKARSEVKFAHHFAVR